jgi:hypothetical protein
MVAVAIWLIAGIAFAFWALTAVEAVETRVFTSS